jgi:hypothetical protein
MGVCKTYNTMYSKPISLLSIYSYCKAYLETQEDNGTNTNTTSSSSSSSSSPSTTTFNVTDHSTTTATTTTAPSFAENISPTTSLTFSPFKPREVKTDNRDFDPAWWNLVKNGQAPLPPPIFNLVVQPKSGIELVSPYLRKFMLVIICAHADFILFYCCCFHQFFFFFSI